MKAIPKLGVFKKQTNKQKEKKKKKKKKQKRKGTWCNHINYYLVEIKRGWIPPIVVIPIHMQYLW